MEETREFAIDILELFEEVLDENNITIPDTHRKGDKEEARIYGETYYYLEDKITTKLKEFINKENKKCIN